MVRSSPRVSGRRAFGSGSPSSPTLAAGPFVHGEIAGHHAYIEELLPSTTPTTIHQRLRDEHGLRASLASFRRYLRQECGDGVAMEVGVREAHGLASDGSLACRRGRIW